MFFASHLRSCEILAKLARRKTIQVVDIQVLALCTENRFATVAREDFVRAANLDVQEAELPSSSLSQEDNNIAGQHMTANKMKKGLVNSTMALRPSVAREFSAIFCKIVSCLVDNMFESAKKANRDDVVLGDIVASLRRESLTFAGYRNLTRTADAAATASLPAGSASASGMQLNG